MNFKKAKSNFLSGYSEWYYAHCIVLDQEKRPFIYCSRDIKMNKKLIKPIDALAMCVPEINLNLLTKNIPGDLESKKSCAGYTSSLLVKN